MEEKNVGNSTPPQSVEHNLVQPDDEICADLDWPSPRPFSPDTEAWFEEGRARFLQDQKDGIPTEFRRESDDDEEVDSADEETNVCTPLFRHVASGKRNNTKQVSKKKDRGGYSAPASVMCDKKVHNVGVFSVRDEIQVEMVKPHTHRKECHGVNGKLNCPCVCVPVASKEDSERKFHSVEEDVKEVGLLNHGPIKGYCQEQGIDNVVFLLFFTALLIVFMGQNTLFRQIPIKLSAVVTLLGTSFLHICKKNGSVPLFEHVNLRMLGLFQVAIVLIISSFTLVN
jgi:hypothetical protein